MRSVLPLNEDHGYSSRCVALFFFFLIAIVSCEQFVFIVVVIVAAIFAKNVTRNLI